MTGHSLQPPRHGRPTEPGCVSRRRRAGLAFLIGALVTAAGGGAPVAAHATLVRVEPPAGAVVPIAPDEVVVTFSESVSLNGGSAQVFDDEGVALPVVPSVDGAILRIGLPAALDDGSYLVSWRVISADSHAVTGTSVFSIGTPSANVPTATPAAVPVAASAWRIMAMSMAYAGVLVAVGTAWFARRWYRRLDSTSDESVVSALRRLDRVTAVACAMGVVGLLAALVPRLVTVGGRWDALTDDDFVVDTLTGPVGWATLVSITGLTGLWAWRRWIEVGTAKAGSLIAGIAVSLLAIGGFVLEGHTRTKDPTWLMVTSDFVHMAAAATWLGGVAALWVLLPRLIGANRARVLLDVSTSAIGAVVAVAAAGVAMSVMVLPSFNALADTGYGLALIAKVILVVALLAIGERNRLVLVPAIEESMRTLDPVVTDVAVRRIRRSVAVELGLFAAVLVATAVLVGRSPVVAGIDPVPSAVSVALSSGLGTAEIRIQPGRVGENAIELTLADTSGVPLVLVEPPTAELREQSRGVGPLQLDPVDLGDGRYRVDADIPFAGTWELDVTARTGTFDSGQATVTFAVTD